MKKFLLDYKEFYSWACAVKYLEAFVLRCAIILQVQFHSQPIEWILLVACKPSL